MNEQNLELIDQETKRLLEDDLSKVKYGSEDSEKYLQDLKELCTMANEAKKLQIEEEKIKADAEAKAKERRTNRITALIDAGAKILVGGAGIVVCVLSNKFTADALKEVLNYESGGEYISSMIGKSVIGGLFRKGK